jgi:hypothetical protein
VKKTRFFPDHPGDPELLAVRPVCVLSLAGGGGNRTVRWQRKIAAGKMVSLSARTQAVAEWYKKIPGENTPGIFLWRYDCQRPVSSTSVPLQRDLEDRQAADL